MWNGCPRGAQETTVTVQYNINCSNMNQNLLVAKRNLIEKQNGVIATEHFSFSWGPDKEADAKHMDQ